MSTQTDAPTRVMDQVPAETAEQPPRPGRTSTWVALAAGAGAFALVVLLFVALGSTGGSEGGDGTATAKRLAGADRYETAVAISARAFPDSAPVVYLIPQDRSPDALAASSLSDGPVLVVPSCGDLPAVVRDEIRRLGPDEVIALGGEASICDEIVRQATAG